MKALNLLYFLDVLIMVIKGGTKRSNGFIHHIHGSSLCLSHGRNDALIPIVRIKLVDLWCSWIQGQLSLQNKEREDNKEKEKERLH